jgi:hypothetical protein
VVDCHLAREALSQQRGAFIVQRAAADIDRLDLRQRLVADCLIIAFANQKIVFDDTAERGERQHDRLVRSINRCADLHDQPVFLDGEVQMIWPDEAR